ncbi:MAG TPA: glutathione peroxidase [Bacteroidales bacterium]|nr:glutathione peroxidase [Bacteroidales bacterium]
MKTLSIIFILITTVFLANAQSSFYELEAKTITGETVKFESFQGKKLLIVNTASKCGFTKQYEDMEKLYKQYGGDEFLIIGFPANNFMNQEPGTNEEIMQFCSLEFGVTFPMMAKISVKGDDIHPVYKWLTVKELNGVMDSEVKWNFQKYLIDETGNLVKTLGTRVNPMDEEIIDFITN